MAVTITAPELVAVLEDVPASAAARMLEVASEMVTRYAPDAPDAIQNEAVIRAASFLAYSPGSSLRGYKAGEVQVDHAASQTSVLQNSSAADLLSPYRVRRARAV